LLVGIWTTAAAGIVIKFALPGRLDRVSVGLYLLLGWSGMMIIKPVIDSFPALTLWLLAAGGLLYTFGVAFYSWRTLRFHTAIWHGFVLVAATCHYFAVLNTLV
jgi:hemolysin III